MTPKDRERKWRKAFKSGGAAASSLIRNGADPNEQLAKGLRPLLVAISRTAVGQPEFIYDSSSVLALLEGGADPNIAGHRNNTPLHCAAFAHRADVMKMLVEAGATANCVKSDGKTPLHSLCEAFPTHLTGDSQNPSPEIVHLLVAAGADPMQYDLTGGWRFISFQSLTYLR